MPPSTPPGDARPLNRLRGLARRAVLPTCAGASRTGAIIDEAHGRVRPSTSHRALAVDDPTYEALWEQHIDVLARVSHRLTKLVRSQAIAVDPAAFSMGFFVGIIDFRHGDDAIDYLKRSFDEATIASSSILAEEPRGGS